MCVGPCACRSSYHSKDLPLTIHRRSHHAARREGTSRMAGKTVLVVDDHETTRQTIARMLEAGGFTVRTATNGVEALDRLSRESAEIDMVLSDVTMPEMGGIDL